MNINFNDYQLKKLKSAHSKNIDVTIQLTGEQIGSGKHKFDLRDIQIKKLKKAKQNNKGIRLELTIEQLKKFDKTGRFLANFLQ